MSQLYYDKRSSKTVNGEKISYGIVHGNEKIVFVKTGAGGNIRGYQAKYPKMAHRIHQRLGATVICASNPDAAYAAQEAADKAMISEVAAERGFGDYEAYFVGTSDGGYQNLLLAQQVPQTKKILGINASLIDVEDLINQLNKLSHVDKVLVYGTKDEAFQCVPALQAAGCDNLEILTVEGADHDFTGMVEEFITLTDLL